MRKSTIVFSFAVLCVVLAIARCNSRSRSSAERGQSPGSAGSQIVPPNAASASQSSPSSSAGPAQANKQPTVDFKKAAEQIQPAVVLISVFEASGKLFKTGTGFFVSDDGKVITSRSLMDGAAHAVVKMSDGRIHNVSGILEEVASLDLAVLKANPKEPVRPLSAKALAVEKGARIAVIGSPLSKHKPALFEGTISARQSDQNGESLELSMNIPTEAIGSPVVNESGEVIGVVARSQGSPPIVVRPAGAMTPIVGRTAGNTTPKWLVTESPPAPAEGPKKVPLAGEAHPGKKRLIYSPSPKYPQSARRSTGPAQASGRFRLTFAADGEVKNVTVLQSTRNAALDEAALEALRQWKSAPGQEWTANVPITFQP